MVQPEARTASFRCGQALRHWKIYLCAIALLVVFYRLPSVILGYQKGCDMTERIRINLSVDKEMNDLLTELAELTGRPKTTIVKDFLDNMQPAMEMTRDGLKALKDNKSISPALQNMINLVEDGMKEMNEFNQEVK